LYAEKRETQTTGKKKKIKKLSKCALRNRGGLDWILLRLEKTTQKEEHEGSLGFGEKKRFFGLFF